MDSELDYRSSSERLG